MFLSIVSFAETNISTCYVKTGGIQNGVLGEELSGNVTSPGGLGGLGNIFENYNT